MRKIELLVFSTAFLVIGFSAIAFAVSSCNDTDGGLNYGVTGFAQGYYNVNDPRTYYSSGDWCFDGDRIYESYCNGTLPAIKNTFCSAEGYPYGCVSGHNGGYCQPVAPSPIPSPTYSLCVDKDGGLNYATASYVEGYVRGYYFSKKDTCTTRRYLREYYCIGNTLAYKNVDCYSGYNYCLQTGHPADNGACYRAPAPAPASEQPLNQMLLLIAGVLIVVIALVWFAKGKFGKSGKHGKKK